MKIKPKSNIHLSKIEYNSFLILIPTAKVNILF